MQRDQRHAVRRRDAGAAHHLHGDGADAHVRRAARPAGKQGSQQLQTNKEPITLSVNKTGKVFIQETEIKLDELGDKLKSIAKNGVEEQIFIRGDKGIDYGTVMKVMGRVKAAGFTKVSLITEAEGT